MSRLDDAKAELYAAAQAYRPDGSDTRLLIAAVQVARELRQVAAGVPAAQHQAELKGPRLCPTCRREVVLPVDDGRGGSEFVEQKTFRIHRCGGH